MADTIYNAFETNIHNDAIDLDTNTIIVAIVTIDCTPNQDSDEITLAHNQIPEENAAQIQVLLSLVMTIVDTRDILDEQGSFGGIVMFGASDEDKPGAHPRFFIL